ncbi:MAG: DUF5655 domain-containing protein [Trueperaceae bacterium]|nr:DUF5655 domain-containing protein [Trueperaceae bacterium]
MTARGADDPAVDAFFAGRPASRALFDAVRACVEAIGPFELRTSTSQVAFRRRVGFAYAWVPGDYVRSDVPLVLTVGLRRRDPSPRWKQVVEPRPGRFTHHLELRAVAEVDDAVRTWLEEAWGAAG